MMGPGASPYPMSSRCSICDINFAPGVRACPVCNGETWFRYKEGPDADWRELVKILNEDAEVAEDKEKGVSPYIADAEVSLFQHAGKHWVPHNDLIAAGYLYLESFTIIKIEGRFYELQGHVGKTARNFPGGAWLIEEIHPEDEIERFLDRTGHAVLTSNPEGG